MKTTLLAWILFTNPAFSMDAADIVRPGGHGEELAMLLENKDSEEDKDLAMLESKATVASAGDKGEEPDDREPDSGYIKDREPLDIEYLYLTIAVWLSSILALHLREHYLSKRK